MLPESLSLLLHAFIFILSIYHKIDCKLLKSIMNIISNNQLAKYFLSLSLINCTFKMSMMELLGFLCLVFIFADHKHIIAFPTAQEAVFTSEH